MFDELKSYKNKGHFIFRSDEKLSEICNAPTDKGGVYLVYALAKAGINLIYIGSSGKKDANGEIEVRKTGLGGLKDRLVNGHQFGKVPRKNSWPVQMLIEDIDALDVYWYVTHDEKINDCPRVIGKTLLDLYRNVYGGLPGWNKR